MGTKETPPKAKTMKEVLGETRVALRDFYAAGEDIELRPGSTSAARTKLHTVSPLAHAIAEAVVTCVNTSATTLRTAGSPLSPQDRYRKVREKMALAILDAIAEGEH